MSEIIKPESTTEQEKPVVPDLPRLENATFFHIADKNMFYLAIPVDKTEPLIASFILDSMKMQYAESFASYIEAKRKKIEIAQPGVLNSMRDKFLLKSKKA